MSHSKWFHSYEDDWLLTVSVTPEQPRGIFIVPHLLWHVRGVSFCCLIRRFAKLSIKSFTISDGYWRPILIRIPTEIISWMNWSIATHIVGNRRSSHFFYPKDVRQHVILILSKNSNWILFSFYLFSIHIKKTKIKKKEKEKKNHLHSRTIEIFDYKLMFHFQFLSLIQNTLCNQWLKTYYIYVGMPSQMKKQIQMDFYLIILWS